MNPHAARTETGRFRAAESRFLQIGLVWLSLLPLSIHSASALSRDVLLIGDSITEGFVSGPDGVDTECGGGLCYAARLDTLLGERFTVVNAGVGGATTVDWTGNVPGIPYIDVDGAATPIFDALAAPNLPTDIVVILLGVNDAIGFFEVAPTTPDAYAANLGKLIGRVTSRGAEKVILATPTPLFAFDEIIRDRLSQYSEAIHALCMMHVDVVCGPDLLSILTPEDFEGGVDIHPNAHGHERIASALAESITSVPEPSVALCLALGLAALSFSRKPRSSPRSRRSEVPRRPPDGTPEPRPAREVSRSSAAQRRRRNPKDGSRSSRDAPGLVSARRSGWTLERSSRWVRWAIAQRPSRRSQRSR